VVHRMIDKPGIGFQSRPGNALGRDLPLMNGDGMLRSRTNTWSDPTSSLNRLAFSNTGNHWRDKGWADM
jgi:hypothetical protein